MCVFTVSHYVHMLEAEMQDKASVEAVANLVMQMNYSNKVSRGRTCFD